MGYDDALLALLASARERLQREPDAARKTEIQKWLDSTQIAADVAVGYAALSVNEMTGPDDLSRARVQLQNESSGLRDALAGKKHEGLGTLSKSLLDPAKYQEIYPFFGGFFSQSTPGLPGRAVSGAASKVRLDSGAGFGDSAGPSTRVLGASGFGSDI